MRIGEHETHPAADAFPMLEGDELARLRADVKAHGLLDDIWRHRDRILDGRNRLLVCLELGVEPRFREYEGDDPIGFVVSANIARRHLYESQRALVAARLATLTQGRRKKSGPRAGLPQADAAEQLDVGERTVRRAREVLDQAEPELVAAIERGDITLKAAAELAKLPRDKQLEAVVALGPDASKAVRGAVMRGLVKAANDGAPDKVAPELQLLRAIVRATQQIGATAELDAGGVNIAFRGHTYKLTVRELEMKAAG